MNPGEPRESWFVVDTNAGAADFNMAFDEVLLQSTAVFERPLLRFYAWDRPAASFGYSQKFVEVSDWTKLRPLIRRPTGGGLVPHDSDWTYSLVFPPGHWWYSLNARDSYRRTHEWIRDAFALLDVATELSPVRREEAPGQCFVGAEQCDLLWHGKKIAGAAQRRNRQGLLIQGSVQPPPIRLERTRWQEAMCEAGRAGFKIEWQPPPQDGVLEERVRDLVQKKYALPQYNQRR
jgi:lipoate-protein ligase A